MHTIWASNGGFKICAHWVFSVNVAAVIILGHPFVDAERLWSVRQWAYIWWLPYVSVWGALTLSYVQSPHTLVGASAASFGEWWFLKIYDPAAHHSRIQMHLRILDFVGLRVHNPFNHQHTWRTVWARRTLVNQYVSPAFTWCVLRIRTPAVCVFVSNRFQLYLNSNLPITNYFEIWKYRIPMLEPDA